MNRILAIAVVDKIRLLILYSKSKTTDEDEDGRDSTVSQTHTD